MGSWRMWTDAVLCWLHDRLASPPARWSQQVREKFDWMHRAVVAEHGMGNTELVKLCWCGAREQQHPTGDGPDHAFETWQERAERAEARLKPMADAAQETMDRQCWCGADDHPFETWQERKAREDASVPCWCGHGEHHHTRGDVPCCSICWGERMDQPRETAGNHTFTTWQEVAENAEVALADEFRGSGFTPESPPPPPPPPGKVIKGV